MSKKKVDSEYGDLYRKEGRKWVFVSHVPRADAEIWINTLEATLGGKFKVD